MSVSTCHRFPTSPVELLEPRRLFSAEAWGTIPQLIGQDDAADRYASLTGKGQTIAVIDTGIDYTHPALGGGFGAGKKVIDGYDFVDRDADPMDTYGHGTGVAGVIAADAFVHNGRSYRGIAPEAKLVALRIDEANEPVPDDRIEEALKWIIARRKSLGITIVNISFGYGTFADAEVSPIFGDELKTLKSAGVFTVASSGNNGVSNPAGIQYPAADPSVYSVGAIDEFGTVAEFTERSEDLDLLAPGADIATTALNDRDATTSDFRFASGTSYAAPFVAGTVALMRQADASLRLPDIRSILRVSAVDTQDGDDEFGATTDLVYQRLHLEHALELTFDRKGGSLGSSDALVTDGNDSSLAYDEDGVLHVVYYHAAKRTLEHVIRATDGGWSQAQIIDSSDADVGNYSSMALDENGRPAVAYFDALVGDLKFARYDGDDWSISRIDTRGITGLYPSLVFDRDGAPVISYYFKSSNAASGDLRLARHDGNDWVTKTLDSNNDVGRHTTMAMDGNGRLAIAYDNTTTGHLRYIRQTSSGGWIKSAIDTTTQGVSWMSLAFDDSNRPNISYYDAHPADLKFARLNDGQWQTQRLASRGAVGLYNRLVFDDEGAANVLFFNRQINELHRFRGSFDGWSHSSVETGGGRYLAATLAPNGALTYAWFASTKKVLHVQDIS
ncbi:MAG TPA: S8 family serine peptidase [Tepidisphaeraceae bacterium]|nr:S8 family serine peptidase [Tepidisphaeraceae bacterium]